jgi:hypothetical protein
MKISVAVTPAQAGVRFNFVFSSLGKDIQHE